MVEIPSGIVTFLFTDIEGSTTLWEQNPKAMKASLAQHNAVLRQAIEAQGGRVFKIVGDSFQAAFRVASDGLAAALAAQRALQAEAWGETGPLRVRMGLHVGPAEWQGDDYATTHTLNRAARVMSAGHGGQILLSLAAAELAREHLPAGVQLQDLGEHHLKGLRHVEHLFQVVAEGLPVDFPPLNVASVAPALLIGTTLHNRYRIEAELGRGGIGVVYRAHDAVLERPVAIKVLSEAGLGSEGRARLLREAQAVARLNHPNIVSVYDAGEAGGAPFIVMELVEGSSLHDRRPSDMNAILAIARQVCAALEHAHTRGIIHRDLKPENVLLTPDGAAKLMDFGLARSTASRLTAEGALVGTVFYLAPEQALGREIDQRVDLYSLGVVLYELVAGRLPFAGDDPLAVISQHLYASVVPPSTYNPEVPPALDALILKLLAKDPADRLASAVEVRQALESLDRTTAAIPTAVEVSPIDRIVRGRLVAREHELAEAMAYWRRAVSSEGGTLLVSGEPGIGKTRLVREVVTQARLTGAQAFVGECYAEGGSPYAPIAQIIEAGIDLTGLRDLSGLVLADLLTLAPDLRARLGDAPPNASSVFSTGPPLDLQAEQRRLFESFVKFCAALAALAPVLLVVDDAHWADSGTLALLRHLARRGPKLKLKLLLVLTYREVELDEARALNEVLADLSRERLAARIKLTRFTPDQTRDLLAALFAEEITPEFLEGIYHETEGNPFFIEEVCKALIDDGKVYREGRRWRRPDMSEIQVPQNVRVAIQARVGKLPEAAQEALRLAAILGREFDFETLRQTSELDEEALIDALERAERAQLVEETQASGRVKFVFAHALIPSALVEHMSSLRRQRLHRRAAAALERLHADRLDELAPRLGRHFAEAGEWDKAVEYLLKAADRAREVYAYQEAIDAYQEALTLLKERGEHERAARTLLKLGLIYHLTFDFPRSREAYQQGFALRQKAGEARSEVSLPPAPHALRLNWPDPQTLDPSRATDTFSISIIDQLFSGLVELSPEMDVVPDIARSWEVLEGGRKYLFHLRADARWSDGAPVSARDFEYAWKRALDPATGSQVAHFLFDVKGAGAFHRGEVSSPDSVAVRALDDRTLSVELEAPTGYFLHLLTTSAAYPLPRRVVEAHGAAWTEVPNIVANGPFKLEAWQPGQALVLARNPEYRGRFTGNVQRVEMSVTDEGTADLTGYEAGNLDLATGLPPAEIDRARQRHPDEFLAAPGPSTFYVRFDASRPPFDDAQVRRAFAHAVDRETLADEVMRGLVSPAAGGFVPPGLPGHSAGIGLPYDPDQARRLLAEAGYPDGQGFPAVDLLAPRGRWILPLVEYLQTQWRASLGLEIRFETMKWAALLDHLDRTLPPSFVMGYLADYPDPDCFLRVAFAQYDTGWSNEAYLRLVEAAGRVMDQAERMRMCQQADRILTEEAAVIPLVYGRWTVLAKPWVKRYPMSPLKAWHWKDVIIEPH